MVEANEGKDRLNKIVNIINGELSKIHVAQIKHNKETKTQ